MRIPRVYIGAELAAGLELALERSRCHYLKNVLRLKPGAAVFLFNGREAVDYRAILETDGKGLCARIEAAIPMRTESSLQSTLIQGLGRSDHVDWSIQKTTELGVNRILIFNAERSQSPLKSARADKKLAHWQGVAISACEQCGRSLPPRLAFYENLAGALAEADADHRILLDFAGDALADVLPRAAQSISILLGPEGGLSEAEIETAQGTGFRSVNLGPRIMRTETAATVALALLQSGLGDI